MSHGKFINWGTGGFTPDNWKIVYQIIRSYRVDSVIEYGCGVSTELMMAIGLRVISLETQKEYADIPNANIILCEYGKYPSFNERFDLAFIDGPGAREFEVAGKKPERTLSAVHAKQYSNLVYMHDGGLGQNEVFDDKNWRVLRKGDSDLLCIRCE